MLRTKMVWLLVHELAYNQCSLQYFFARHRMLLTRTVVYQAFGLIMETQALVIISSIT